MNYFETIKIEDYEIYNLPYHQKRISKTIGKNIDLQEYIYCPNNKLLKCKVLYDADDILDVRFDIYQKRNIKIFQLIYDDTIKYDYKYENRENINALFSKGKNADEIIIIKNGFVTDTSIANIAIELKGQWFTPKKPLLYGTTRQRYIDDEILKECNITVKMLQSAKKIALLNAMIDFDRIEEYILLV